MQVMIKDSKKYAATDGWGFGDFKDGQPVRRGDAQSLLLLPRTFQRSRLCLHPLRTLELCRASPKFALEKNASNSIQMESTPGKA